jgi:hypothetical protein
VQASHDSPHYLKLACSDKEARQLNLTFIVSHEQSHDMVQWPSRPILDFQSCITLKKNPTMHLRDNIHD